MKDFQLSFTTLTECKKKLSGLFIDNPKGKYRLTLTKWTKKRSISINRQQHLWYNQIAKYHGDQSQSEVKNFCKHTFGIPILLNDDVGSTLHIKGNDSSSGTPSEFNFITLSGNDDQYRTIDIEVSRNSNDRNNYHIEKEV